MPNSGHTFHIPVMGTAFTVDSPIRVARYGISSVISLVDDNLIEEMRKVYAQKFGEEYAPIRKFDEDWRARRITEYLNLVDRIVKKQIEELKRAPFEIGSEITKYFEMLPDTSPLKMLYKKMLQSADAQEKKKLQEELRSQIKPGRINVNIMTKIDRMNVDKAGDPLPEEFSDALAALRGYAQSTVESAIVLSAGLNRRLYSYFEQFKDFYADATGYIKKQIIIKVSDHRSAITQGKFFAKKGLWVSEYRIESGLNCGGHVFAGNGHLMGPVLEEFKQKRVELMEQLSNMCCEALKLKNKLVPQKLAPFRLTTQGGIGTAAEDLFLRDYYHVDSTGWGSPFLLVPEATQVDDITRNKLAIAREDDIVLSDISPLGVPFHTLKESASELNKKALIESGKQGSACPLGHLVNNTEFTEQPICTASRQYQNAKVQALKNLNLPEAEYQERFNKITAKACICSELGDSAFIAHGITKKSGTGTFPAICPGPNLANFNKIVTLREMIDHIYGRINLITRSDRPHMFVKELRLNIEFYARQLAEKKKAPAAHKDSDLAEYRENLLEGIRYYQALSSQLTGETAAAIQNFRTQLDECTQHLARLCPAPAAAA